MKKSESTWTGKVVDRMTNEVTYKTRPCTTWEEACKRAAKKAGKSDRYRVVVE